MELKIAFFIFVICVSNVFASPTYSQVTKISLDMENRSLEQVMDEIEKQSEFYFIFNQKQINVNRVVDLQVENKLITDILPELFKGTNVNYVILDKKVLLTTDILALRTEPQQVTVRGTVTDISTGEALPGVNVIIKGTTVGTITNADGKYSLDVPSPSVTLQFSFIGYLTQDMTISGQNTVNLAMTSDVAQLSEVVVVGYGTQRKKDLTGSVSSITSTKLLDKPAVNIAQALQGKVAGLKIIETNAYPGAASWMRIRGTNSINSSNSPLFVVDGIIGLANVMTTLNPNQIQSVDVLKDASATAIYGARGANGVIIITTKRGISGKPVVEYNAYVSAGTPLRRWNVLNADEAMYAYLQGAENQPTFGFDFNRSKDFRGPTASGSSWSEFPHLFKQVNKGDYMMDLVGKDGKYYAPRFNTDWWDETMRTAISTNHEFNIRGGSETAKFGLFIGALNEQGLTSSTGYKRFNSKATADIKVAKWLELSTNINYTKSITDLENLCCNTRTMIEAWSFLPIKYPNDPAIYGKYAGNWSKNSDFPLADEWSNPIDNLENSDRDVVGDQIAVDLSLNFKITQELSFKSTFAYVNYNSKQNMWNGRGLRNGGFVGNASISTNLSRYWQNENYFNYVKEIGDHNISGMLGLSWNETYYENFSGSNSIYFDDFYKWHNIGVGTAPRPSPASSDSRFALNSYFGRANYGYKSKYLLTLTGRYDGSSKFGGNSKYGFFPSGSVAWRLSEEEFIKNITTISNLKLRFSLGKTGNQEIGSYVTQTKIGSANVIMGGKVVPGLYPTSVGNQDLAWETTTQSDVGLDIGLFQNRITLVVDYYNKLTTDMLLDVPLPESTTTGMVKLNYGSVENKGIEITLGTHNIKTQDFNWYTDLTWSRNRNKIVKLGPTGADIYTDAWIGYYSILREGESIGSFWGLKRTGIFGTNEVVEAARYNLVPGDIKYEDRNKDGKIAGADINDGTIIGNVYPKWDMDISNTVTYKNFDFSIEYRIGIGLSHCDQTSLMENLPNYGGDRVTVLDSWTPYNQNSKTKIAALRLPSAGAFNQYFGDDAWVQDASFIRGEGATLGYTFPQSIISRLGIKSFRAYLNAKNFSLYAPNFTGLENEGGSTMSDLVPGIDFFGFPRPRQFSFGVNVVF